MSDTGSDAPDETAVAGQEQFEEMLDDVDERVRQTTEVVEEHEQDTGDD
jgi:hypothetical protein